MTATEDSATTPSVVIEYSDLLDSPDSRFQRIDWNVSAPHHAISATESTINAKITEWTKVLLNGIATNPHEIWKQLTTKFTSTDDRIKFSDSAWLSSVNVIESQKMKAFIYNNRDGSKNLTINGDKMPGSATSDLTRYAVLSDVSVSNDPSSILANHYYALKYSSSDGASEMVDAIDGIPLNLYGYIVESSSTDKRDLFKSTTVNKLYPLLHMTGTILDDFVDFVLAPLAIVIIAAQRFGSGDFVGLTTGRKALYSPDLKLTFSAPTQSYSALKTLLATSSATNHFPLMEVEAPAPKYARFDSTGTVGGNLPPPIVATTTPQSIVKSGGNGSGGVSSSTIAGIAGSLAVVIVGITIIAFVWHSHNKKINSGKSLPSYSDIIPGMNPDITQGAIAPWHSFSGERALVNPYSGVVLRVPRVYDAGY